ncbi:MAG: BadF/BadG/BcrA/BcrD ATPase family protein, partial [Candidatus Acidiferrum sp.]
MILAYAFCMRYVLGFDGGGTKTDCVLMDESGAILARAQAGPSNPLRVGFGAAITAIREAARQAVA